MVLIWRTIVVGQGALVASFDQEVVVEPEMLEVVHEGGNEARQYCTKASRQAVKDPGQALSGAGRLARGAAEGRRQRGGGEGGGGGEGSSLSRAAG